PNKEYYLAAYSCVALNRWPVPKPFWCYPTWHKLEEEVDLEEELKYQREQY
uniref:Uncharacterized protein n=1 Tax=Aegilops tauschii subsp. strangulata TaxID=200361 RepID=A0A453DYA2_AEGTS